MVKVLFVAVVFVSLLCTQALAIEFIEYQGIDQIDNRLAILDDWVSIADKATLVGLSKNNELVEIGRREYKKYGLVYTKYDQYYEGIRVVGGKLLLVNKNNENTKLNGHLVDGLNIDPASLKPSYPIEDAIAYIREHHAQQQEMEEPVEFGTRETELVIYIENSIQPVFCYMVTTSFVDTMGKLSAPIYLMDAKTKRIVKIWETAREYGLYSGAEGGNSERTGLYYWNNGAVNYYDGVCGCFVSYPGLLVYSSYPDIYYTNDRYTVKNGTSSSVFSFNVFDGPDDEANDGYSPSSDVFGFANVVSDMFNDWYGIDDPIENSGNPVTCRVHYFCDTAGYGNREMRFSDGGRYGNSTDYHPFTTLNVVGHEIGHGLCDTHGGIAYYSTRSVDGINEAFCDMTGETAEYYFYDECDYKSGSRVRKTDPYYHRNMEDPRAACRPYCGNDDPLDDVSQYNGSQDAHNVAGIFNEPFSILAKAWGPQTAYQAMLSANLEYWDDLDSTCSAYEGWKDYSGCFYLATNYVISASDDLSLDLCAIENAFRETGAYGNMYSFCP